MQPKKSLTLGELASRLKGELVGDGRIAVSNIRDIDLAGEGDIAFIFGKKIPPALETTRASCVIVPERVQKASVPIIRCPNVNLAFKEAVSLLKRAAEQRPRGVHPKAEISRDVIIGKDVSVGAYTVIENGAEIGDGTVIYPHCYVGEFSRIGSRSLIYPNVTVRENVKIGNNVIIQPGCSIGGDGFGYERTESGHEKIPHIGGVIIEDDVELGACVTVDRAKIANTVIGKGTKIDNLVQIAHNVVIGKNCVIVAQAGLSGSVKVGNNVMMGGKVGIADHLEIGDNVLIAANAGLMKSVPANTIMWGLPARPLKKAKAMYALFDKLPEIYERLKALEKHVKSRGLQ